jgi:protein O-mannosyl-transferase
MKPRTLTIAIVIAIIVGIAYLVHSGALMNAFTNYDDDFYTYENYRIKTLSVENVGWLFTHGYFRSYTPLAMVSHAVDFALWGMNPKGHHLTNLIIHSLNAAWVFTLSMLVFVELKKRAVPSASPPHDPSQDSGILIGAAVAAVLFAVHPLKVESVGWVSDRKDLLCTFFFLPALAAYVKYGNKPEDRRWYAASLLLFVFAVLSKTIAVVTPVVMLCMDFLLLRRGSRHSYKKLLREKIPFFVVSIGAGLAAMGSAAGSDLATGLSDVTLEQRILYPAFATFFYVGHLIFPVDLTPIYELSDLGTMAVCTLLFAVLIVSCIYAIRKGVYWWALVWAFYVLAISPTFFGIAAGIQPLADRYTYLPLISFFILAGGIVQVLWERYTAQPDRLPVVTCGVVVIALVVGLGVASARQMTHWRSSETLWRWQLQARPTGFGYNFLGHAMMEQDRDDEAIEAFTQAVRLRPGYVDAYNNLGAAYSKKGMYDDARKTFLRLIEVDPHYMSAYFNLGNVLRKEGKVKDAMLLFERALEEKPGSAQATYELGVSYEMLGDTAQAVQFYQKAISLKPDYVPAYISLSNVYLLRKGYNAAIGLFREAIRMSPRNPETYYNLGCVYYTQGDTTNATQSFIESLRIDPGYARSYFNLGVIFGNQDNDVASLEAFRKAAHLGDINARRVLRERGYEWE